MMRLFSLFGNSDGVSGMDEKAAAQLAAKYAQLPAATYFPNLLTHLWCRFEEFRARHDRPASKKRVVIVPPKKIKADDEGPKAETSDESDEVESLPTVVDRIRRIVRSPSPLDSIYNPAPLTNGIAMPKVNQEQLQEFIHEEVHQAVLSIRQSLQEELASQSLATHRLISNMFDVSRQSLIFRNSRSRLHLAPLTLSLVIPKMFVVF
jgi:hypothetical protein